MVRSMTSVCWHIWTLVTAVGCVLSVWLYVLPAAILGLSVAKFETWHLLPLFALANQVVATVFFGLTGALVVPTTASIWNWCRRKE